ncbi:MAG: methenyltetrahydrofolate cyclohydrolase [Firmicutes bacterium HGW-Firmicutes-1]|jgi:formiminotetrahydrofolate cyclodeaminase|nr:MAG: methenyltetrahydrofolate cyclohydrolase [Firmicutes bacterium HGW-Firmicutes-1]
MLIDKTIVEFLNETASSNPVPGGGSIAAQSGATAAALVEMVANLTIGKKAYEKVSDEMIQVAQKAGLLRAELVKEIDRDSDAFNEVMAAYKLPKDTKEDQEFRSDKIQESTKYAALVPLEVARKSYEIINLSREVVAKGNKNAVTDGIVSAMMARTSALSAIYNVKINLSSIKDDDFVERASREINEIEAYVRTVEKEIIESVQL